MEPDSHTHSVAPAGYLRPSGVIGARIQSCAPWAAPGPGGIGLSLPGPVALFEVKA